MPLIRKRVSVSISLISGWVAPSVSSSTRRSAGTSSARHIRSTRSGKSRCSRLSAEMLNATQVSMPSSRQSSHWRRMVRSPHKVSSSISPCSSASGTKRDGSTGPSSGSSQRTSASTRTRWPSRSATFGWYTMRSRCSSSARSKLLSSRTSALRVMPRASP